MKKKLLLVAGLAMSLTFFNSCEQEDDTDTTGTTTSSTTSSTTSGTTSGSTTTSTTTSSTTSGTTSGSTTETTTSSTTGSTTSSTTSGSTTEGSTTSSTTSGSTTSSTTTGSTTGFACAPTSAEVVIGTQTWSTNNLDVDKFSNGDIIPEAKTDAEWQAADANKTPAWCYYLNSADSGAKYGKLYNWYAVSDSRGLAPAGWHVPSRDEWYTLSNYLGGESTAGVQMKNTCGWNKDGNGSNLSGLSFFPSGKRIDDGSFGEIGSGGRWWCSSENGTGMSSAHITYLYYGDKALYYYNNAKGGGLSVRCLKN